MALATAWWMQETHSTVLPKVNPNAPHRSWPWAGPSVGISFHVLQKYLEDFRYVKDCDVYKFMYCDSKWRQETEFKQTDCLIQDLKSDPRIISQTSSTIYVTLKTCPEVIQSLGYFLEITPRFFNFSYVPLSTGNHVSEYAFFHLQFMDMYPPGSVPYESTRSQNSPSAQFNLNSGLTSHTWKVTRVALIYWKLPIQVNTGCHYRGVIQLDSADDIVFRGLRKLMTRNETIPPGQWEAKFGLGQVLSELLHIISHNWSVFLGEAEQHLQIISKIVAETQTTHEQQKEYSLALHQLSPLWAEVRRRVVAAKDCAQQMMVHPFFDDDARVAVTSYLKKVVATLEDYEKRTEELDTNTNLLINLIFNLATFMDTAAAIQESRAANSLAASIRRVAMLTFFYLPLQVAASIYGMNVRPLTDEPGHQPIWAFAILAATFMLLTCAVWYLWSSGFISWIERCRRDTNAWLLRKGRSIRRTLNSL